MNHLRDGCAGRPSGDGAVLRKMHGRSPGGTEVNIVGIEGIARRKIVLLGGISSRSDHDIDDVVVAAQRPGLDVEAGEPKRSRRVGRIAEHRYVEYAAGGAVGGM